MKMIIIGGPSAFATVGVGARAPTVKPSKKLKIKFMT
jgi:hypothetical protein